MSNNVVNLADWISKHKPKTEMESRSVVCDWHLNYPSLGHAALTAMILAGLRPFANPSSIGRVVSLMAERGDVKVVLASLDLAPTLPESVEALEPLVNYAGEADVPMAVYSVRSGFEKYADKWHIAALNSTNNAELRVSATNWLVQLGFGNNTAK